MIILERKFLTFLSSSHSLSNPWLVPFLLSIKSCVCLATQSCPTLCNPTDCSPPGSSVQGDSPGGNTGVGYHALPQGIFPNPGMEPRSPAWQVDSLPSEPAGKCLNTGVGSLALLQGVFLSGIKLGSPAPQADSLPAEIPGKPNIKG